MFSHRFSDPRVRVVGRNGPFLPVRSDVEVYETSAGEVRVRCSTYSRRCPDVPSYGFDVSWREWLRFTLGIILERDHRKRPPPTDQFLQNFP